MIEAGGRMVTLHRFKARVACLGIVVLAVAVFFLAQHVAEKPEARVLTQNVQPVAGPGRGKILLSLSSAMVRLAAGPPGTQFRVDASFDPDVYILEQHYETNDNEDWTYSLDFHERSLLHISVIRIWLGKRQPEVRVRIPAGLPFDLEATMRGGYLVMGFADLAVASADVELNRGVLRIFVSDPMDVPMQQLSVRSKIGSVGLDSIGNASPSVLDVRHGLGAALVDLRGRWRTDAAVNLQVAYGTGVLQLPGDVAIAGLGRPFELLARREIPPPTLRISAGSELGRIRVID
jgi:hypothetical protein